MTDQKAATLLITSGGSSSPFLKHPVSAGRVDTVDIYDLADAPLQKYRALLLPMYSDQRHLFRHGARLEAFLGSGGILIFSGHVAYPFLPELQIFEALPYRQVEDLFVYRAAEHPIWQGVRGEDLTFRKGVAGFYGRGCNPPPPEAVIINTLGPERLPLSS
jgi:hypothetical protein